MPPRPPVRARAVQRQLFKSPDPTCPFDEVSGNSFRRFASSVPGPLESRRRLGKRRLTQVSDSFIPTLPGSLWSLFPDVGGIKWEWQAPTDRSRAEKQNDTTRLLPSWLLGLGNAPQQEDSQFGVDDVYQIDQPINEPSVEVDVQRLQESIQSASHPRELEQALESFLPSIKQNLALGLVSGDMLGTVLQNVTQDFRDASAQWNFSPNQALFLFYTACWEGMQSCRVLRPVDFEGKVIDTFLTVVACLPFNEKLQDLATSILQATSQSQHSEMEMGIRAMVTAWSHNWLAKEYSGDCREVLQAAETTILEIEDSLEITRNYVGILEQNPHSDEAIFQAKGALSSSQSSLGLAESAIKRVDDIIWPLKRSARRLATALEYLPTNLLSSTILSFSNHIVSADVNEENGTNKLRYYWLSTISHLANASDRLFLESWKKLEVPGSPFSETQCCHLILGRWTSQGLITRFLQVEISFTSSNLQDLASLLFSINKCRQHYLRKTKDLFLLLESLGKLNMAYGILLRLRQLGLKLPITQLCLLLKTISTYDAKAALKIYGLHHDLRMDYRPFPTHFLHHFIPALIRNTNISPSRLWRHLRIPLYESRPRHQRNFTPRSPQKQTIELLNLIALEYARCETRSTRMALRSVLQCLYHLRLNNVPITPELSLAISHTAITREVLENQFVGQERLRYAISIIEEVEGKKVAHLVDTMVFKWREYLSEKSARERREGNVLRVGPID